MFLSILLCMGIAAGCLLAGRILLHYFQLESYQFPGYFRTVRRNLLKSMLPGICMMILLAVSIQLISLNLTDSSRQWYLYLAETIILIAGGYFIGKSFSEKKAKKAFVITPRVKRLYATSFIVLSLLTFLLMLWVRSKETRVASALILVFPALLPGLIALCGLLAWPLEKIISELYFRDAQRILKERDDLLRIGITGSWGKTSVKFILGTILGEKYQTLVTPASYNTPMGVTKVIRSRLEAGHRIFIAEMGARHVGDIKEMCRLVHPQIGILTSVGPQHLDTFRTLERITKTKYELIDALPADGKAFFADDDGICRKLYNQTEKRKYISGLDSNKDDVWAEEIAYSPEGSSFLLCTADRKIPCCTQLLGELNIRNILLCASVALDLGLTMEQISRGIRKINPIEHRLQLIRHPGGLNVIDDAFNSNIRGARQAFDVLKQFPKQRIVVTPGMVELGERENEMNREFGQAMADCCDIAILVGKKRSEAIRNGLQEKGFPEAAVRIVSSLTEATEILKEISGAGDTVLFENDLPDNYTE
ncbi:Mur ligase family protein [Aristaeella hokkaidonensis]|uniref:UDP-N-acetylmuramoyl-tripeptide--D-alanyl-D-alanine ligase n=1 Tax=Aristaeella hokkaidonensis TaxID=3046382 RepID=A0AC61N2K2_9FIRM|nr:UDP-N-acetylmuramoyl-tripeptide--D-alanyl-D-alanine ligase [Aristaeella hokkaidonensis]QUC67934.1 UDP-N-acetylmuramoyl-tripeptide--D-alanyl-D-alanine ligase [Aristaeella hokkaidonensis]SNT93001.1 UDP-N-acetylmuramoyl-tripeptide--D-alanyl-D-alanine ligase [Aristaeella hokkaidonensis]